MNIDAQWRKSCPPSFSWARFILLGDSYCRLTKASSQIVFLKPSTFWLQRSGRLGSVVYMLSKGSQEIHPGTTDPYSKSLAHSLGRARREIRTLYKQRIRQRTYSSHFRTNSRTSKQH